ncbi:hypothetical protein JOB18_034200 [Solea senegalensis]|uniref:Uncharacterized protein n=1 Tax=Solea senegalensis TaxID=28829 RepID=A0AAV6T0M2_SOLSE|nr:hypothetical protein JOB18_034200 [Solea senegalensis]
METVPWGGGAYSLHFNYLFPPFNAPPAAAAAASQGQRSRRMKTADIPVAPRVNDYVEKQRALSIVSCSASRSVRDTGHFESSAQKVGL